MRGLLNVTASSHRRKLMISDSLFSEALTRHGIPCSPRGVQEVAFIRWGDHRGSTKYWAMQAGDSIVFGDFSIGLKEYVFPKGRKRPRCGVIKRAQIAVPKDSYLVAAKEAQRLWDSAGAEEYGYLINKWIDEFPEIGYLKVDHDDDLVIPITDRAGTVVSIQFIGGEGDATERSSARHQRLAVLLS
ncbi:MAG: hypothetical protein LBR78_01250 [Holosporales bacterium]|jgi:hypothetical protein|nr:hypothetical protein [Holosporales bacterium]